MMVDALLVLFVFGVLPASPQEEAAPRALEELIDSLAAPLIEQREALGLVVGVLQNGEESVHGYGRVTHDGDSAPDGATLYEIGSITKVFTGLLLADAVEEGLVGLDDPIARHLPDTLRLPAEEPPVLLRHLVTHTSGLPRIPDGFRPENPQDPYAGFGVAELYSYLEGYVLDAPPGERYAYSNLGFGLLGHVLCQARALPDYEQLLLSRVCRPLGLNDTRVALNDSMRARFAAASGPNSRPLTPWNFDALAGCGAIRSTVRDLLLFAALQLDPDRTPLARAIRRSHERLFSLAADGSAVAYGWHVGEGGRTLGHNGQTGGFHALLLIAPAERAAVAILASSTSGKIDEIGVQILKEIAPEKK
ncbi:MAG: beta-lactamase family protein [Planctomycetes bacterium]|nr:beta-lactamase family protein [Planctomycetota bacterium]